MALDEGRVDEALVRLCASDGRTLGTGFFVAENLILTCHHVVAQRETVQLQTHIGGEPHEGHVESDRQCSDLDVAVVGCPTVRGRPLPIDVGHEVEMSSWTKGFQFQGYAIRDAFPVRGRISGTTRISYRTGTTDYSIDDVLRVESRDTFDHGISGAPLIDPDSGVAFAIVNTRFGGPGRIGGFALPFGVAVERCDRLARILAGNRGEIPRFGRYLNALGARSIFEQQRAQVLRQLELTRRYLTEHVVPRSKLDKTVKDFLRKKYLIFPIVGSSGVGKTSYLATLAASSGGARGTPVLTEPSLLILAAGIDASVQGLDLALTAELKHLPAGALLGRGDLTALVEALRREGERLVVLFDALNEVQLSIRASLESWIARSVEWLERTGSRLIVSCQPAYWDLVSSFFPAELLYRQTATSQSEPSASPMVRLDDFSDEEAEMALRAYGLPATLSIADVRHPTIARIYWEFQDVAANRTRPFSRHDVFDRFVDEKCRRIARTLDAMKPVVHYALSQVAKAMLERRMPWLSRETFFELFRANHRLGEEALREYVFVEAGQGFRFTFDEVAEFLEAEHLDLDETTKQETLFAICGGEERISVGVFHFAVLRLAHLHPDGATATLPVIERFVDAYVARPADCSQLPWLVVNIFADLGFGTAQFATLKRLAEASRTVHRSHPYLVGALLDLDLGLPEKFELLRFAAPTQLGIRWKRRRWSSMLPMDFRTGLEEIAAAEVVKSPVESFRLLLQWLGDITPIDRPGTVSATVGDFAAGLVYHSRELAFAALCEMLADLEDSRRATELLFRFSKVSPQQMVQVCRQWARSGFVARQRIAAYCCRSMPIAEPESSLKQEIIEIARVLSGSPDPIAKKHALLTLNRLDETRDEVRSALIQAFLTDDPMIDADDIAASMPANFAEILTAFEGYLETGRDLDRKRSILWVLRHDDGDEAHANSILTVLERTLENNKALGADVALAVEEKLYASTETQPSDRLLRLAEKIASEERAEVRRPLIYFATEAGDIHRRLLSLLIEREDDEDNVGLIIDGLAEGYRRKPWAFDVLAKIGRRLRQDTFERLLVESASTKGGFAAALVPWLNDQKVFLPLFETLRFLIEIHRGEKPRSAARKVIELRETP